MPRKPSSLPPGARRVSLKMLAEYLDLSPATVSFVLNNAPGRSIPPATRERVKAAAKKFGYQPSLIARSLQGLKTQTIGILLPELGEGYHSLVLSGAAEVLMQEGYFFFTAHHRHRKDLVAEYPRLLQARGVDGILAIDTQLEETLQAPTVSVAGHTGSPLPPGSPKDRLHAWPALQLGLADPMAVNHAGSTHPFSRSTQRPDHSV